MLQDFFSKSYTHNPTPKQIYSPMTNPINTLIFHFHSVSSNQIREIVMAFPSDKVPGYDKLPMSIIKDTLPGNFLIVMDIVYRRLLTSVFPTAWKISEIIPLPKEGDHDVANNMQQQPPCVPAHCSVQNMWTCCFNPASFILEEQKKRLTEQQSGNNKSHLAEILNVRKSYHQSPPKRIMECKLTTLWVMTNTSRTLFLPA